MRLNETEIHLPFDPAQVIENLRHEQCIEDLVPGRERLVTQEWIRKAYYLVITLLPVSVRRHLQRAYFSDWQSRPFPAWPVDCGTLRWKLPQGGNSIPMNAGRPSDRNLDVS